MEIEIHNNKLFFPSKILNWRNISAVVGTEQESFPLRYSVCQLEINEGTLTLGRRHFERQLLVRGSEHANPLIAFLNFPVVDHSPITSALARTQESESNLAVFRQLTFQTSQQCNTFQFEIFIYYKMTLKYINLHKILLLQALCDTMNSDNTSLLISIID